MSKLVTTRPVRSSYPSYVLLIDYGLSEKTVQGLCYGLDQLFSIITSYVGVQRIPLFGLIVNGQNQSEVSMPLSSTRHGYMELQVVLCKLQLLAQKWSMRSNRNHGSSLSWHSALQLAWKQMTSNDRKTSTSIHHDFQLVILTNRLSDSIISDICQFTQVHQYDSKKIELVYVNDDDNIDATKQSTSLTDLLNIKYVSENKYSVGLYFKSWLLNDDHDSAHLQLYVPPVGKTDCIDHTWHLIRCDLQEILIDPHHHTNHERFFIYTEPSRISNLSQSSSSMSLSIYQLKALNFIKQAHCCISMIFGMPMLVLSTKCQKHDTEQNQMAFRTLTEYLRRNELMLVCRMNDCSSTTAQSFSGHFVLSVASENSLVLRSIASSELLLPHQIVKHEQKQMDDHLINSLSNMNIDNEEYNPLYYDARKSKITLNTNLI